jgi:hypothetical protein
MLSTRLIQMIEDHAEQLTQGLARHLKSHPRTASYRRFSDTEIHNRTYTVYKNLGAWTVGKPEGEIRRTYEELGLDRFEEGIPLHEVIYALIITKNHLLNYVRTQGLGATALEIYGEQELANKVNQFYDNAIYYTVVGYERALRVSRERTAERLAEEWAE